MKTAIPDAAARQHSGGPSPVPGGGGDRNDRAQKPGPSDIEAEIAGLIDRSTQELRLAWRKLHRTEPPFGVSRDLLIRSLASNLEQRAHGSPNLALRRRLQILAGARWDLLGAAMSNSAIAAQVSHRRSAARVYRLVAGSLVRC